MLHANFRNIYLLLRQATRRRCDGALTLLVSGSDSFNHTGFVPSFSSFLCLRFSRNPRDNQRIAHRGRVTLQPFENLLVKDQSSGRHPPFRFRSPVDAAISLRNPLTSVAGPTEIDVLPFGGRRLGIVLSEQITVGLTPKKY
jgi:hypothetical protein